jgi:hypothetical protein
MCELLHTSKKNGLETRGSPRLNVISVRTSISPSITSVLLRQRDQACVLDPATSADSEFPAGLECGADRPAPGGTLRSESWRTQPRSVALGVWCPSGHLSKKSAHQPGVADRHAKEILARCPRLGQMYSIIGLANARSDRVIRHRPVKGSARVSSCRPDQLRQSDYLPAEPYQYPEWRVPGRARLPRRYRAARGSAGAVPNSNILPIGASEAHKIVDRGLVDARVPGLVSDETSEV